jgi:hypothetical protein
MASLLFLLFLLFGQLLAPNRRVFDTGSTSPRSVGEVAVIRDTISHYSPVLIALLSNQFLAPASGKKERIAAGKILIAANPPMLPVD